MAVPDGWPSARFGGRTEPGLQAGSPAAHAYPRALTGQLMAVPGGLRRCALPPLQSLVASDQGHPRPGRKGRTGNRRYRADSLKMTA